MKLCWMVCFVCVVGVYVSLVRELRRGAEVQMGSCLEWIVVDIGCVVRCGGRCVTV